MQIVHESAKANVQSGSLSTAAIIAFIYATVREFAGNIAINPLNPDVTFNIAIFVPALAAILFGKNTGGLSAGVGGIFIQIQDVLLNRAEFSDLPLEALIASLAGFVGAYTTGYLTQKRKFFPSNMKEVFVQLSQWKRIILDTIAAIIGMALTNSFIQSYGSQVMDQETLLAGVPVFLTKFFAEGAVLLVFIPLSLLLLDLFLIFQSKRGLTADLAKRDLNIEVSEEGGAEFISAVLAENALTMGSWAPLEVKFRNKLEEASAYGIEGVSTAKMYPHMDKTKVLQPGEEWMQTFYVLSGKQDKIDIRIQITPQVGKAFKRELADDTTIEIQGNTVDPSSYELGLAQFGGLNFGVMGLGIIWDDIVGFLNDPRAFFSSITADLNILVFTALIESALLGLVMYVLWRINRGKEEVDRFLLSFAQDHDAHGYEEIIERRITTLLLRYQRYLLPLFRFVIIMASLASVGFLGYEGFKFYSDSTYTLSEQERIMTLVTSAILLAVWIVALRGLEILEEFGIKSLPPWVLQPGNVILDFKPLGQFQEGIPNEVVVMAQNPTENNGIRIVFQGFDSVSPPMVEIHAAPKEIVYFKIAVTPMKQENRDILALVYPFFDEDDNEIDFNESEPFNKQEIQYQVMPQTIFGITKEQQNQLVKFGGVGAAVTAAVSFAQQLISVYLDYDTNIYQTIQDNAPYLAILQAPIAYVYFYIRNTYLTGPKAKV